MKKIYIKKPKKNYKASKSRLDIVKENTSKRKTIVLRNKLDKKVILRKLRAVFLVLGGIVIVSGIIGGLLFFSYLQSLYKDLPTVDKVFPELPVASEVYDRKSLEGGTSTRLYRLFSDFNSDELDISEIPDTVKLAFIATEDKEFFNHSGFDPVAIVRCARNYLFDSSNPCGASTITQQLVKLTAQTRLDTDKSRIQVKLDELLLASKVEQTSNKEEVLEMYLKATPFGSSIVGVKTASLFYFGKEPRDLSLAQSVMLASIIQNPSYMSPTVPLDQDNEAAQARLQERMDYVFGQLEDNKDKLNYELARYYADAAKESTLTTEMITAARAEDWKSALKPPIATDKKAGHFVNYVLEKLQRENYKNGTEPFTLPELQQGGYKIYTTLDYDLQKIAEEYARQGGVDFQGYNANNAAIMTTIPSTGQIITMAGSRNYYGGSEGCNENGEFCKFDGEVNILTSLQEPGSSNKPLGYEIAFAEGKLSPGSFLPDYPISIKDTNGSSYDPRNWDFGNLGINLTAEQALRTSRNIPAVQVVELIGVQNYVDTAIRLGYTTYTGSYGQSVILGGASILPIEHVQAFGVFANGGDLVKLNSILKIIDKAGKTVYEAKPERQPVADPQGVYLLNRTIFNYDEYSWDGRDIAGKTGTTQENKDAWYMAYTPDLVTACWSGNNNNDPMVDNAYPINIVHPWCKNYLRDVGGASYFSAATPFPRPGGVIQSSGGSCNDKGECVGLSPNWMIEGRTPKFDRKVQKFQVCSDQDDRLARPIDITVGKAMEKEFTRFVSPVEYLQEQLDKYISGGSWPTNRNDFPKDSCNIDRTGGINGPFFYELGSSISGTTVNFKGKVFTSSGVITSASFQIQNADGVFVNIPGCVATSYNSFDVSCDVASIKLNSGGVSVRGTATDSTGVTNVSGNIGLNLTSGLSFTSNPPASLKYGNNVGAGCSNAPCSYTIAIGYNQSWSLSNIKIWQVKNGVDSILANLPNTGSTTEWGLTILPPGGSDTYSFYITADTSTGGKLRSGASGNTVVTP